MERGLEQPNFTKMTVLTYRGNQYIQNKENSNKEPLILNYRSLEIMSKRIHDAMKAEMG